MYKVHDIYVDKIVEGRGFSTGFALNENTIWQILVILYTEAGAATKKIITDRDDISIERICQFIVTVMYIKKEWLIKITDYHNHIDSALKEHKRWFGDRWDDTYQNTLIKLLKDAEKNYYSEAARLIIKK